MKHNTILMLCVILLFSCKEQDARRPVIQKTATIFSDTIEQTKQLIALENNVIENYLAQDSTKQYNVATNGFWYSYVTKKETESPTPKIGDVVEISYDITDLYGSVFYTKEELGNADVILTTLESAGMVHSQYCADPEHSWEPEDEA